MNEPLQDFTLYADPWELAESLREGRTSLRLCAALAMSKGYCDLHGGAALEALRFAILFEASK